MKRAKAKKIITKSKDAFIDFLRFGRAMRTYVVKSPFGLRSPIIKHKRSKKTPEATVMCIREGMITSWIKKWQPTTEKYPQLWVCKSCGDYEVITKSRKFPKQGDINYQKRIWRQFSKEDPYATIMFVADLALPEAEKRLKEEYNVIKTAKSKPTTVNVNEVIAKLGENISEYKQSPKPSVSETKPTFEKGRFVGLTSDEIKSMAHGNKCGDLLRGRHHGKAHR